MTERKLDISAFTEREKVEVESMGVVTKAELLMPGILVSETNEVYFHGRTIEQIAKEAGRNVYGVRAFRVVEGTVLVDGKPVRVSSSNFDHSGTAFIDGQIMNVNDVKNSVFDSRTLVANMENIGIDRVVKTRTGNFVPFNKEDRIITVKGSKGRDRIFS